MQVTHHRDGSYSIKGLNPHEYRAMMEIFRLHAIRDHASSFTHFDNETRPYLYKRSEEMNSWLTLAEKSPTATFDRWDVPIGKSIVLPTFPG